jgi:hypothetical protein
MAPERVAVFESGPPREVINFGAFIIEAEPVCRLFRACCSVNGGVIKIVHVELQLFGRHIHFCVLQMG